MRVMTVIMATLTMGSVIVLVRVMMVSRMMPLVTMMPVFVVMVVAMVVTAVQEVVLHALDARDMQLANRLVTVLPSPERLRTPLSRKLRDSQQLVVFHISFQMNLDVGHKKAVRLANWTVSGHTTAPT